MPRPSSFAQVEIETGEQRQRIEQPEPDAPFHIAVLGDFSGRENRGTLDPKLLGRKPFLIDRDNFDDVLAKLAPELHLPLGGPGGPTASLLFRELEDFHPDRIFEGLKIFQALRETRERLHDPTRYDAAAAQVRSWSGEVETPQAPLPKPAPDISRLSASELFEQTLSATEARSSGASPARAIDDFQALLRDIVAPYAEPKPDPQKPELVAQVDAAVSGQMRALLHHPQFQALESAWRALFFLVRRLSTDSNLKIYLLDIAKPELATDMVATYELLIEHTPREEPWAVLAGNYTFDQSDDDLRLLGRMAAVAKHAGAPLLAGASPAIFGCNSLDETPEPRRWQRVDKDSWNALRRLPQATWVGLALPRFLLRLPYGKQTNSTENFAFEEFGNAPRHEDHLWGNAGLACTYLLGEAFSESGWDLRPGEVGEISGLPVYVHRADGESHLKPCAEALLTEQAAEAILDHGLMPLLSIKGSDAIRLIRFQSIAEPVKALSGRWS
jgi:type VI secretion system protein ImpC